MVFSKNQGTKKCYQWRKEQVSGYKYLGSWVTEDGKSEKEVKARIGTVWQRGFLEAQRIIERKREHDNTEKTIKLL